MATAPLQLARPSPGTPVPATMFAGDLHAKLILSLAGPRWGDRVRLARSRADRAGLALARGLVTKHTIRAGRPHAGRMRARMCGIRDGSPTMDDVKLHPCNTPPAQFVTDDEAIGLELIDGAWTLIATEAAARTDIAGPVRA